MKKSLKMEDAFVEVWNNNKLTYPEMEDDAKLIVSQVRNILPVTGTAKKIGDVEIPISTFWRKFIPQVKSALPKTDIMIGKYKFSMKYRKDHLLFSGGQGETLGAFYAALEDNQEKFRQYVMSVIEEHTASLKTVRNDDMFMKEFLSGKHTKARVEIQNFFDTNKDFLNSFLYEILSGNKKFEGNPIGIANAMLLYDLNDTKIFTLTKNNITKNITGVKVNIRWRKFQAKDMIRSILVLEPKKVEEGVMDTLKSVISYSWDKIMKMFGLEPNIDVEIKW